MDLAKNKVLLLELNEFNPDLLKEASNILGLKNIQKMLSMVETKTFTDDTYESDFLEPWVQWVSVHTGKPSSEHQIKHLGDVPHLTTKQLWEALSGKGVTSGIWGAMNASLNSTEQALFFLPDPWTASENAHPKELQPLLDALRLGCKNYLNLSWKRKGNLVGRLIRFLHSRHLLGLVIKEIPHVLRTALRFKGEAFAFISLFDLLSTRLFLKMKDEVRPDFSLLFLNSIAHLQHHHWKGFDYQNNPRLIYGLRYLDRMLEAIFDGMGSDDMIIVTNALSQKNTNEETPWILYRQIDQASFLKTAHIVFDRVESHMTHDAHIFFARPEECLRAKKILEEATIEGEKLFLIEYYPQDPLKLFYRIVFTDKVEKESAIKINGLSFRFFDLFKAIVRRTGKHIPHGVIYCNREVFPKSMKNHELFPAILKLYN
ncbi:MAG: hypothetical protein K9M07_06805 [Simkaniaceae bacterium]|nr:hypothetical protein [Simkaniaceae bacterium]